MGEDECGYKDIEDYKTAFECFKQRFLVEKKSIFRLRDKSEILNSKSIEYLVKNFVNNGYGGKASFIDKIKMQLVGDGNIQPVFTDSTEDETVRQNAIEVLAHCVWLWRLVPADAKMSSTKKSVQEVLDLADLEIDGENQFFNEDIKGFASVGTYYNTNKPFELAFVIKFLEKYLDNKNEIDILLGIEKKVIITSAKNKDGKCLSLTEDKKPIEVDCKKEENGSKTASIFNALLHLFKPKNYEAIVSNDHKEKIVNAFENKIKDCKCEDFKPEIDCKIKCIKEKLKEKYTQSKENMFFYEPEVEEQWNPTILPSKNVIYYGAPGTGKTYNILELVKRKVKNQCNEGEAEEQYFKVVQFHPSYGYEDFIDGIKPVKSNSGSGNINLELVDGKFKKMCKEAFKELKQAKRENREAKKYYFIADEINRAELSRVFGELLVCLEEEKRLGFNEDGKLEGLFIETQNSSLWKYKNAVLKVGNGLYFGVPKNIYFLATMNDIDKSIDSFDMALRRRFKWVYKGCDYDVIYSTLLEKGVEDEDINTYISNEDEKDNLGRCNMLNCYIRETLNLGASYEIGHSYFMNIGVHGKKISKVAYENLFDFELAPLLTEYLRSEISDPRELKKKLNYMKKIFTQGEECNDKNSR